MKISQKNLLQLIYDHYQNSGQAYPFELEEDDTSEETLQLENDIQFLLSRGYIKESYPLSSGYLLVTTEKGENFLENGFKPYNETPNTSTKNIFKIKNATNSVIGTQSNVTMNIGDTIQKTREQIDSSNSPDKEELQEIINLLEKVIKGQTPVKKGLFSKFSDAIQKNSWITSPVTSILLNWLMLH